MNDIDKVIASANATAHLFFSLRHFGSKDKLQIYYIRVESSIKASKMIKFKKNDFITSRWTKTGPCGTTPSSPKSFQTLNSSMTIRGNGSALGTTMNCRFEGSNLATASTG
jgi:hypothetical protein